MPHQKKYGLSKEERLCSRKEISRLFENGNSFFNYPFNLIWTESSVDLPFPARVGISVSKRSFKKAVDRNRIKREIREAYRIEKGALYNNLEKHKAKLLVMIIYVGNDLPRPGETGSRIRELITKFSLHLDRTEYALHTSK